MTEPKLYRPSNGMEGEIFKDRLCYNCTKESDEDACPILTATLFCDPGDPDYPTEWQYGEDGEPTCTAFDEQEGG